MMLTWLSGAALAVAVAVAVRSWRGAGQQYARTTMGPWLRAAAPALAAAVAVLYAGSAVLAVVESVAWFFVAAVASVLLVLAGISVVLIGLPRWMMPPPLRGIPGLLARPRDAPCDACSEVAQPRPAGAVVVALLGVALAVAVVAGSIYLLYPRPAPIAEAALEDGGSTLVIRYQACPDQEFISVDEDDHEVAVSVRTRGDRGDCGGAALLRLDRPLGDRRLTDRNSGVIVPVEPNRGHPQ